MPRFANLLPYAGEDASVNAMAAVLRGETARRLHLGGGRALPRRWKRPLVVKGILHPADAEKAVSLGVDGIVVSNHGGRQVEALPAAIDALPAVVAAVGERATVMLDSGVRSGVDVVRALALGAKAAFAGKAFLWGLGALGAEGPGHVIDLMVDEMRSALGQIGARSLAEAPRHHGAPPRRAECSNVELSPRICAGSAAGSAAIDRVHHSTVAPSCAERLDRDRCSTRCSAAGKIDVGDCRNVDPVARRRPAGAAQRAGAGGRAGARRRQQHRHRRAPAASSASCWRPTKAWPPCRSPCMVVGMWLGTLPVGALARRYRPPRRAPGRLAFGVVSGLICCAGRAARLVLAVPARLLLRRALCRRAPVLPLRRDAIRRATRSSPRRFPGCWPAACSPA